jgi:hypothetical protein
MVHFDAIVAATDAPEQRYALTLLGRARVDAIATLPPAGSPCSSCRRRPTVRTAGRSTSGRGTTTRTSTDGCTGSTAWRERKSACAAARSRCRRATGERIDGALGASVGLELDVVAQPLAAPPLPLDAGSGELRVALRRAYVATAEEPVVDPVYGSIGGFALRIPGIASDFVTVTGGEFCERSDEAAELYVELRSPSHPRNSGCSTSC